MLVEIDNWIAKKLFFPLIIKVCQKFKITQYTFANYCVAAAYLCMVGMLQDNALWLQLILLPIIALVLAIKALNIDSKASPSGFWRFIGWMIIGMDIFLGVATGFDAEAKYSFGFWSLMLFAEYARMIDTIPPEEIKEKVGNAKPVPVKG